MTRHLLGFSSSVYYGNTTCRSSGKCSRTRGVVCCTRLGSWDDCRYRGDHPTPLVSCNTRLHSCSRVLLRNFSVRQYSHVVLVLVLPRNYWVYSQLAWSYHTYAGLPNSAFRLIVVLGYNGITDGSTNWTTICHWLNGRHYDATSFCSCGCSFVVVLQGCECKTRSSTGFLRFSCCWYDSLRDYWYMFYGAQRGIDFLLLMSFPPTILFTFGKPSLLIWRRDRNSHGIDVVLFQCCIWM